jgi:hypothetical protein
MKYIDLAEYLYSSHNFRNKWCIFHYRDQYILYYMRDS